MGAVGFIGLGIMGESMCENIIKKSGQEVYVYDVDPAKIKKLQAVGGKGVRTIEELAEKVSVIVIMVPNSSHVKDVIGKIEKGAKRGTIVIDMSTISPKVSAALAATLKEKGITMLDAPVVKSKPAAIAGELGIYVGGDKKTYEKILPILECMGKNIIYMGKNGSGLIMKLCHNMLVGSIQNGVNEMLVLAEKAGLKFEDTVTAVSYGGGQCFYLDAKNKSLGKGDFTPAFPFEHMAKDMGLARDFAREVGISLQGLKVVNTVYKKGIEQNLNREDFSASLKIVREMASAKKKNPMPYSEYGK
jgi:3-hydroxyisobutyrate dehydrogenase-like beta-hydroxyacid dehydrogenase